MTINAAPHYKTFSIHEKDMKVVRHMKKGVFSYKHLENMLNILLLEEKSTISQSISGKTLTAEEKKAAWSIFSLLLNPVIMKGVLSNNTGGEKTQANIKKLNDYYQDNALFQQAKAMHDSVNAHNMSMIVRRLKKDWDNAFKKQKEYAKNPHLFKGKPEFPRPKKLSRINQYSVPLEDGKFSLKRKNVLGITLFKRQYQVRLADNHYIKSKQIKSVTVAYSHGHIYYHLTYIEADKVSATHTPSRPKKAFKAAGLDIGVINIFSLFVQDETTKSVIVCGKRFIKYNCYFNKQIAALNTRIAKEVVEVRFITNKRKEKVAIPVRYSQKGQSLIKQKSNAFEYRKRFFDNELNKLSKKLVTYLKKNHVTDLVISRNLSFTKQTGEIKMQKKTKQKFYQIPFGRLLNLIENKAIGEGIRVNDINESYTSKTSCISADVNAVKQKKKNKEDILPTDLNGNRGSKGAKIGRGLFKDKVFNVVFNADLNGAANHIKVGFSNIKITDLACFLVKLTNPVKLKSAHEFDCLLSS